MRINGSEIAQHVFTDLRKRVEKLKEKNVIPHLAVLLIGNDPASVTYINQKSLRADDIGAKVTLFELPQSITTEELLLQIKPLNNEPSVHGIIVQRPFPSHIDTIEIDYAINPEKDVDAFHPETFFIPPLALAVQKILNEIFTESSKQHEQPFIEWLQDKKIVILGKGKAGGLPLMQYFDSLKVSYALIDRRTEHPDEKLKSADIILSAAGSPHIIHADNIKSGVILIGIGLKKVGNRLMGDYDEESVASIASFYTPSPGGVGPVNVAMLLSNLVTAAEQQTV